MVDHFACTLSFLQGAFEEQQRRLHLVDEYRHEMKLQGVTGQTHTFNFIDHMTQLVSALQENSNLVNEIFAKDLLAQLIKTRELCTSMLRDSARAAIEYGTAFWVMVNMLINSLKRLGFGVRDA